MCEGCGCGQWGEPTPPAPAPPPEPAPDVGPPENVLDAAKEILSKGDAFHYYCVVRERELKAGTWVDFHPITSEQRSRLRSWDYYLRVMGVPFAGPVVVASPVFEYEGLVKCKCGHPPNAHYFSSLNSRAGCNACQTCGGYQQAT